jgi:hypothetical protein
VVAPSYSRFFGIGSTLGQATVAIPYAWADVKVSEGRTGLNRNPRRDGFADAYAHLTFGLLNAPALNPKGYAALIGRENPGVVIMGLAGLFASNDRRSVAVGGIGVGERLIAVECGAHINTATATFPEGIFAVFPRTGADIGVSRAGQAAFHIAGITADQILKFRHRLTHCSHRGSGRFTSGQQGADQSPHRSACKRRSGGGAGVVIELGIGIHFGPTKMSSTAQLAALKGWNDLWWSWPSMDFIQMPMKMMFSMSECLEQETS